MMVVDTGDTRDTLALKPADARGGGSVEEEQRIAIANELEKISLLIRVAARAVRAGSEEAAAREVQDALKALAWYTDTGQIGGTRDSS